MQRKGLMQGNDTFSTLQHPSCWTIFAFYRSWCIAAARTHCLANEIPTSVMSKGLIQERSPELQPFVKSILTVFLVDVKPHNLRNYPPDFWYTSFFLV